jgi:small subunit ribosomal protein S4e
MARGIKKHLKRINAPSHWMLDKLGGVFAPKPSAGPHKTRECLPLILILRNRLKYALNGQETKKILMQRLVKVDGKVRTDATFPCGFMDVVEIPKTDEAFRLLLDTKGRFVLKRITKEESAYKLGKVKRVEFGKKGIPYCVTHDGRTVRYPDPNIKVDDTILYDLNEGKITDSIKFEAGNLAMVTGGHNAGRVGVVVHKEKHNGGYTMVSLRDAAGNEFSTRITNVFMIGRENKPMVSMPKGKGVRLTIVQEQARSHKL